MNLRESFSLPFNKGDIWYSCLDGLKNDFPLIKEKMLKEEKLICRPSSSSFIIYHLYDTEINDDLAEIMINSLIHSQNYISKLAIVGLSKSSKAALNNYNKKARLQIDKPTKYFDDLQLAKEWLLP